MTTYENAPPPPEWQPEPHADPFGPSSLFAPPWRANPFTRIRESAPANPRDDFEWYMSTVQEDELAAGLSSDMGQEVEPDVWLGEN